MNYSAVLTLDTHTCDFVAGSAMSIRNYFRPRNGLSEPTGSISVALKSRDPGTSTLSCARSAEYFLQPVTVPPRHKNFEHTRDTFRGRSPSFLFRCHSVLIGSIFGLSFTHQRLSNHGSIEYSNSFRKTLPWQLLSPTFFTLLFDPTKF